MNITRPRTLIAAVAIAGLVTTASAGAATAAPTHSAQAAPVDATVATPQIDEAAFAASLEAEALDLTEFQTSGTEAAFEVAPTAPADTATSTRSASPAASPTPTAVTMDFAEATSELQVQTDPADPASLTTLDVTVQEATPEFVAFTITDRTSGETVEYRSDEATPSFVPAIPIGIAIGAAAWKALAATAAVVIVAGAAYTAYDQIIESVRANNSHQHYAVIIRSGGLFLGKGMSISEAATWGKGGGDTWSKTQAGARQVAQNVKDGRAPVGPEIDAQGSGKFNHYHPNNRTPAMHAFFGAPRG